MGDDTKHLLDAYYKFLESRMGKESYVVKVQMHDATVKRIASTQYTLLLMAPHADNVTQICRAAIAKGIPFACLMPNCLVHRVSQLDDYSVDKHIQQEIDDTT